MHTLTHTIYLWLMECRLIWKKIILIQETHLLLYLKEERKGIGERVLFI